MEWALTLDGDAMALAFLGPIVPQREMLCASIVPERNGVFAPPKPHLEAWLLQMSKKKGENRIAFAFLQTRHSRREGAIDV